VPYAALDEYLAIHNERAVTQHGVHDHARAWVWVWVWVWVRSADGPRLTRLAPLIRLVHVR
jgi:hypothetical protein